MLPSPRTSAFDTERELYLRARQNLSLIEAALESPAYEALLDKDGRPLCHVLFKLVRHPEDAEDLTLEVFAKAFRHRPRYQSQSAVST